MNSSPLDTVFSWASAVLCSVIIGTCLSFFMTYFIFSVRDIPPIGAIDVKKIIHEYAENLAKQGISQKEINKGQEEFMGRLEDALDSLAKVKKVILLKPETFATRHFPDYTAEVSELLHLKENLEKTATPSMRYP